MAITTLSIKDAAAATKTMAVVDLGSAVLAPANAFVVGTTEAGLTNPLPVIGRVAVTVAPTMGTQTSGSGYVTGDCIGSKLTLASIVPVAAASGTIQSVIITCKSTQTFSPEVYFFNADPSASTFTDSAAFTVNSADMPKLIGAVTCDVVKALGTGSIHQASNVGLAFKLASGTSAYCVVVTRATITTASTSDIVLQVNVLPD